MAIKYFLPVDVVRNFMAYKKQILQNRLDIRIVLQRNENLIAIFLTNDFQFKMKRVVFSRSHFFWRNAACADGRTQCGLPPSANPPRQDR